MTTAAAGVHAPDVRRPSGAELLATLLDAESFVSWDRPAEPDPAEDRSVLAAARRRSGTDESVRTGLGRISGRAVAVICSEFAYLGGTIGGAAADRIVSAVRRATRERLPLLALPASGGTRVHEGTPAFLRMVDISIAVLAPSPPACRTWSTCATPRPAASSRPGDLLDT